MRGLVSCSVRRCLRHSVQSRPSYESIPGHALHGGAEVLVDPQELPCLRGAQTLRMLLEQGHKPPAHVAPRHGCGYAAPSLVDEPFWRGTHFALIDQFVQGTAGDPQLPGGVRFGELGHRSTLLTVMTSVIGADSLCQWGVTLL